MKSIINKTTISILLATSLILSSTAVRAEYPFEVMRPDMAEPTVYSQVEVSHEEKASKTKLTQFDKELARRAVLSCTCAITSPHATRNSIKNAQRLLTIEKEVGIPKIMFGMTLAAACSESCFRENAKGDYKWGKRGEAKAHGILQLWPWVKKYGVDRMNLESSARFWLKHIKRVRKKTIKQCRPRTVMQSWRQAWVTAIRYPKPGGRCREIPRHWYMFKKMVKMKKRINKELEGIA